MRMGPDERGRERVRQMRRFGGHLIGVVFGGLVALVASAATLFLLAPVLYRLWRERAYWPMRDALVRLSALREADGLLQGCAEG